jgi:hypothetical protein
MWNSPKSFGPRLGLVCVLAASPVAAQEIGTASGGGTIVSEPKTPTTDEKRVSFRPKYSLAYVEGKGADQFTWVVLTEKEPPLKEWAASKDRAAARQQWCQKENESFVAVKLNAKQEVDLYVLCPPGAATSNTETVTITEGLKSVDVQFKQKDAKRLKGSIRGGLGTCPNESSMPVYCEETSDYTFDAPMLP